MPKRKLREHLSTVEAIADTIEALDSEDLTEQFFQLDALDQEMKGFIDQDPLAILGRILAKFPPAR